MISTQQMNYIIAVAETGSISRAAEHCFVTQPTLSMQLKKAEDLLGFPVFFRETNKIELTNFGKDLIPILRNIQGDLGAIVQLTERFSGTFKEHLRIGIIPTVAAYMLIDQFEEWRNCLPQTEVFVEELKTEELIEALEQRKIDIAILAGPVELSNWRINPLFEEEILVYAPTFEDDSLIADDLKDMQPWLLNKGNCLRTQMMQFCSIHTESPSNWNYAGGNMDMLIRMVDQSGGYTLIPEFYKPFISSGQSIKHVLDEKGSSPGRAIVAVSAFRHTKWDAMEQVIRSVQIKYGKSRKEPLQILGWR